MSSDILLRGRNVTKIYGSPLHPLARLKSALLNRTPEGKVHTVLKNIDFDIFRGETVGIMGRNGAGKSTLLGILGNVIPETSGTIERIGRIAVLLELGAGFNPNLSGIENARIYCRMMGTPEGLIQDKLDSIEEFAELGDYFEMPVRTYSSGMYSRLGFAAAVHVDADLIIVDETLSVGDASFRMKCYAEIERMKERGMTFLIVSHSQNLIANFCTRAIVLEGGEKRFDGSPLEAVGVYKKIRTDAESNRPQKVIVAKKQPKPDQNSEGSHSKILLDNFTYNEEFDEDMRYGVIGASLVASEPVANPAISLGIRNSAGIAICSISSTETDKHLPPLSAGDRLDLHFKFWNMLAPGPYFVTAYAAELVGDVQNVLSLHENVMRFDVVGRKLGSGLVNLNMAMDWSG